MAELFVTSEELEDKGNEIIKLYNKYLGRDPLQGGLDAWLATGQSIEQIEQGIANSPEAAVFQTFNETVGRDPTMEERDYFVNVNPAPIEAVEEVLSNTQEAQQFQTQQQLDQTDMLADTTAGDTTLDDTTAGGATETTFPTADTGRFGDMIDASATFAAANQYLGVNEAQWSAFVNEVNEIKAQMNAFEGNEARVLQDRSTPDALLDRRIAVLLNQNPGMTPDEARAEAESGEAYQQLAATNAQYEALNERLNQAYASIGLPGAATIAGSGVSGEGYRVDFNLNTGEVTYREVGGSSFLESALGIAIAAVFAGPIAGAIAGATGASAAVATAAASGIVNTATQLAMTGDLDVAQALSAAATGYLNPSASANVMSNPNVASLTQQVSDTAFNEVTGSQIIGELTNASANSGAVVDAISNAVGAAATNAIFGGDKDSGVVVDTGGATADIAGMGSDIGDDFGVDVTITGPTFTLPTDDDSGGGGDTAAGADASVDGGDAGAADPATTVTVSQPASTHTYGTDDDSIVARQIHEAIIREGDPNAQAELIKEWEKYTGQPWNPDYMSQDPYEDYDPEKQAGTTVSTGDVQEVGAAATEQTDAVKAVDWILVNLPNYEDMTEVEINQALEGAGLEPVDINNDGTVTSKSEVVETTNGNQASTVTVAGGNGDNTLTGGNGNDTLKNGNGKDTVTGGNGNDTVVDVVSNGVNNGVVSNGVTGVAVANGKGPGKGPGDGPGDNGGDGLGRTGMLAGLAALPTMAQQPFEPLTQRSIRFDAPTIQPVQIAPTDARKELDNQLARLLNDPQSQRKQSLFGGLV